MSQIKKYTQSKINFPVLVSLGDLKVLPSALEIFVLKIRLQIIQCAPQGKRHERMIKEFNSSVLHSSKRMFCKLFDFDVCRFGWKRVDMQKGPYIVEKVVLVRYYNFKHNVGVFKADCLEHYAALQDFDGTWESVEKTKMDEWFVKSMGDDVDRMTNSRMAHDLCFKEPMDQAYFDTYYYSVVYSCCSYPFLYDLNVNTCSRLL